MTDKLAYIFLTSASKLPPLEAALDIVEEYFDTAIFFRGAEVKSFGFETVASFQEENGVDRLKVQEIKSQLRKFYSSKLPDEEKILLLENGIGTPLSKYNFKQTLNMLSKKAEEGDNDLAELKRKHNITDTEMASYRDLPFKEPLTDEQIVDYIIRRVTPESLQTQHFPTQEELHYTPQKGLPEGYQEEEARVTILDRAFFTTLLSTLARGFGKEPGQVTLEDVKEKWDDVTISIKDKIDDAYRRHRQKDPDLDKSLYFMPSTEEILIGLEAAINRASESFHDEVTSREIAEQILKEVVPEAEELTPEVRKLIKQYPSLASEYLTKILHFVKAPADAALDFMSFDVKEDVYLFDLRLFKDIYQSADWFPQTFTLKGMQDMLAEDGHIPGTNHVYQLSSAEDLKNFVYGVFNKLAEPGLAPKLMDMISSFIESQKEEKTVESKQKRDATYFGLFSEYDLAGSSWKLDAEKGKITKSEVDIDKAVREGGVWDYEEGDKVIFDTDLGFVEATIMQRLPFQKYRIKSSLGTEIEVKGTQLFKK